jgi:hypothetical protein
VWLRPDGTPGPQACPAEADKMMGYMNLHVGDSTQVFIDANQGESERIILYDGPIESVVRGDLGTLSTLSRLYGQVWTSGPHVVIRYYEAQPLMGDKIPFCAVAELGDYASRKLPESKPGFAILGTSKAKVVVVDSFRSRAV